MEQPRDRGPGGVTGVLPMILSGSIVDTAFTVYSAITYQVGSFLWRHRVPLLTEVSRSQTSNCLPMSPRTVAHWPALFGSLHRRSWRRQGVQEPHDSMCLWAGPSFELLSASAPLVCFSKTIRREQQQCGAQSCCPRLPKFHRSNALETTFGCLVTHNTVALPKKDSTTKLSGRLFFDYCADSTFWLALVAWL